jgi:hypothetical protein
METHHFGIVKATVDDQARTITLTLSREPTGEISTKKVRRWAVETLTKKYPDFEIKTEETKND